MCSNLSKSVGNGTMVQDKQTIQVKQQIFDYDEKRLQKEYKRQMFCKRYLPSVEFCWVDLQPDK